MSAALQSSPPIRQLRVVKPGVDRDPISRSTRQPGLSTFHHPLGTVAYARARGATLTLGPPSCAPEHLAEVARAFLAEHPDAAFFYVTREQLDAMQVPAHHVMPVGTDFVLPLPLGEVPELARTALRKAAKQGLTLDEPESLAELGDELRALNTAYLSSRAVTSELRFLNRPCEFERETDARTFVLRQRGKAIGFVVLDAYETSRGQGVLLNLFRLAPTKLWNVYQAVVLMLAERLALEGIVELSLGFVPLTPPGNERMSLLQRVQHAALRRLARDSTYLQRLGVIKHGFAAREVTRCLSSPRALIVRDVRAFVELMRDGAGEVEQPLSPSAVALRVPAVPGRPAQGS